MRRAFVLIRRFFAFCGQSSTEKMNRLRTPICVAFAALLLISGCTPKVEGLPPEEQNLKDLSLLYGQFRARAGRPPKNIEEFKKFLESTKTDTGAMVKVEGDITEFLTSPRDKQPYMIIWGVNARTGIPDPVAYEQTGDGSTRMIGVGAGYVIYADEAKFKEMIPNAK